ncbi:MAG: prolipoprotein diacylglyceryl transferase [Calditrichaeota bacterium]|nr:MAG: prolipoprotein diacylglyceryl transferase [Calditrichota bacterium]
MLPVLFKIGPLTINSFGVMAMLGFLIPTLLMRKELVRFKLDPELANGIAVAAMIGGFLGARIYFIAERWHLFISDPANSFGMKALIFLLILAFFVRKVALMKGKHPNSADVAALVTVIGGLVASQIYYVNAHDPRTWSQFMQSPANLIYTGAGLVWYGGFIGGFIAVSRYVHNHNIAIPLICDILAPLLALGQTFGRMGCLLSGDGDYGPPADVPWAMAFPKGVVPTTERVHPTPIYDMIFLITIFTVLWKIRKKPLPTGFKFSLYLIMVGTERIITEFFRNTPKVFLGLTMAQIISICAILVGTSWILILKTNALKTSNLKAS